MHRKLPSYTSYTSGAVTQPRDWPGILLVSYWYPIGML